MTTTEKLDGLLVDLKRIEDTQRSTQALADAKRAEIQAIVEKESLTQYKNEIATVSAVERKKVTISDESRVLADLKAQKLTKYYQTVPVHDELLPEFQTDVKAGRFTHDAVTVVTTKSLAVRFTDTPTITQ